MRPGLLHSWDPSRMAATSKDLSKAKGRAECLSAQIIKTRRNDRVTKVERRMIIGDKRDFEKALLNSEDSDTLNTSFIERPAMSEAPTNTTDGVERLNLTIRQSTSSLP